MCKKDSFKVYFGANAWPHKDYNFMFNLRQTQDNTEYFNMLHLNRKLCGQMSRH